MREFRTIYSAPCSADRLCKPSYVQRRIHVAMPPSSARTGEAMLRPFSNCPADTTGLRGISRVHENNLQASRFCFVGNKVLKLSEGPAMQPSPNPLPSFNVGSDVGQILHADLTGSREDGFGNDGLAGFVVDVLDMPLLSPGDSQELPFRSPATVGLKPATMGKEFVSVVSELSATKHLARAGSRKIIFSYIHSKNGSGFHRDSVGKIKNQIEVAHALADYQTSLFGLASLQQRRLVPPTSKRNPDPARQSEQREPLFLLRVGAKVKVHRTGIKFDCWNGLVLLDAFVRLEGVISISHTVDSLANHLTAKGWELFPHSVVDQMVQGDPVPAAMLYRRWNNRVTRRSERTSQIRQCLGLLRGGRQFEGHRSLHIGHVRPIRMDVKHSIPPRPEGRGFLEHVR